MHLRRAHNDEYRAIADNRDVKALVVLLYELKDARGPVASVIRDQVGKRPPRLAEALQSMRVSLGTDFTAEETERISQVVQHFYEHASSNEDANKRRGMVLESLVYRFIKDAYYPQECLMQCHAFQRGDLTRRINTEEIDVCAWSDELNVGEAYECKTHPTYLNSDDCTNLCCLADAVATYEDAAFRIGAVSMESYIQMKRHLRHLQGAADIVPFGWDNLDDLTIEPE